MYHIDYGKKLKKKTVNGPGFYFKIPKDFVSRTEDDPDGQWGYGEYFQTNTFGEDYDPQTNMFFYFWESARGELSEKEARKLIAVVCKEKVFSGEHSLELIETFPITFKRFPAFILKYKFSHYEPDAEGTESIFVISNTRLGKVFVLGALVEAIGSRMIEDQTLAWIEDEIVSTFCFRKTEIR